MSYGKNQSNQSDNETMASSIRSTKREERQKAVDTARTSVRLEGFVIHPEIEALNQRYIDGEITSEELTVLIKKAVG